MVDAVADPSVVPSQAPAPVVPTQAPAPAPVSDPNDPFSVDEATLSKFAPEQRAVLDTWKKRASEAIDARGKSAEEKYKAHVEKANALDQLTRHPKFVEWWNEQQKAASPNAQANQPGANPQNFATPEEWSSAIVDASNGDATKLQAIQQKMWTQMATPIVQQLQTKQQQLEMTMQMKNLFEKYPDAKDLDSIGRDPNNPNDRSPSLLEIAMLHAVEGQGKSVEAGYKLAKSWADSLGKNAKQQALGIVTEKKGAVTAGPSTSQANQTVVEVDDFEELTRRNLEVLASGGTPPKFVVKHK